MHGLPICGLMQVGATPPTSLCASWAFLLFIAAALALALDAWVSLAGPTVWLLASTVARAILLAFVSVRSLCSAMACRTLKGDAVLPHCPLRVPVGNIIQVEIGASQQEAIAADDAAELAFLDVGRHPHDAVQRHAV